MDLTRRSSPGQRLLGLLATLLTLLGALSLPAPALATSPDVVISQVYGGGGNSGATWKNDFIELFNRGTAAVSLAGWSVQYASATGTGIWQVTALAGTLQPKQYYLVQEAAGTGGTASLPTPDATGSIAMSATAGKVALVKSTTALSGACPTSANLVDLVGFGGANCAEGSSTPALSNTTAALRARDGCVDTDANSADFSVVAPNPRNTSSPTNPCPPVGTGLATPAALDPGDTVLLTVAVSPGIGPTSTGIAVTADLTAIGGAASQPFYDDASHGDATAGDSTYSFQATLPTGTTPGSKGIPVSVSDAQGRTGSANITLTVNSVLPPIANLEISELLISPATTGQPEEYIKVFNPTAASVDLGGWSLTTVTGTSSVTTATATFPAVVLGPGQSVVATKNGAMYHQQVDPYATNANTFEYSATPSGFGTAMTRNTTATLTLSDTTAVVLLRDSNGTEVDVVRYTTCSTSGNSLNCNPATPYSGHGWSGAPINWPPTQGYSATHRILARAIDEATITAVSAGSYKPDTNTAADWITEDTDSRGWVYWQNPASPSATPFTTRDFTVGQMQSLPLPTWTFNGSVTGFLGPDTAYSTIKALFDGATTSIDLNMYDFALVDLAQSLVNAAQRGVTVRVLLEGEPCCDSTISDQTRYVARMLHDAGVAVQFLQHDDAAARYRRYTNVDHAKYAIVDNGTPSAQVLVFSGNFKSTSTSENPAAGNRDWGVIIPNQDAAAYFDNVFNWDFDPNRRDSVPYGYICQAGPASCNLGPPAPGFTPDLSPTIDPTGTYAHPFSARTVTGSFAITPVLVPETDLLNDHAILGLLKHAQRSILLEFATLDPYWGSSVPGAGTATTPMPLVEELLNAARRGVQVRVLLDHKYDDPTDPKSNAATVNYLNSEAQAEGLNLVARLMPFTVISGCLNCATYLVHEYPGYNEVHNKGIIVDGRQTLISSVNGTQAAFLRNREAAVIVDNADMADYFSDAFWYDWYDGQTPPEWPVISEVQYDPPGDDAQNEWFELYNPTAANIDLTGWTMQNKSASWSFPAGMLLPAGQTLTVARTDSGFQSLFGFFPDLPGETLQLVNTGDVLRLVRPDGTEADKVAWLNGRPDWGLTESPGQSLVRTNACKDTNSLVDWASATPQPGTATCNGSTPPPPKQAPSLLLTEVQYDSLATGSPEPDEFIEIYNAGSSAANLSGYRLADNGGTFTLPSGTSIAPGQYLVVTRDGAAFQARYGRAAEVTGMTLQLGNSGDLVKLQDPAGHQLDSVAWENYTAGWSLSAGSGWSLQRRSVATGSGTAADWLVGDPTPGSGIPGDGPQVSAALTPAAPDGSNDWYRSPVTVSGSSGSWGVIQLEVSADGGATWSTLASRSTGAALSALPVSGSVTHGTDTAGATYQIRATDALGRTGTATVQFMLDQTAPTTTASPDRAPGSAGWYNGDVQVSLSASDALSGVAATEYNLDGAGWSAYTAPVAISGEGTHTLQYRSRDNAGNQEAAGSLTVRIDRTTPEAYIVADPVSGDLQVYGTDGGSGTGGGPLSPVAAVPDKGNAVLRTYLVTDQAGNTLTLVIQVEMKKEGVKAEVVSLQYNGGPVQAAAENKLEYHWSTDKDGLKHFDQNLEIGKGAGKVHAEGKWDADKNQTRVKIDSPQGKVDTTLPGMVQLKVTTSQGSLVVTY